VRSVLHAVKDRRLAVIDDVRTFSQSSTADFDHMISNIREILREAELRQLDA